MKDSISLLLVLIPALPLAATILVALLGPRVLRQYSHLPVVAALAGSFLCSLALLLTVRGLAWQSSPEDSALQRAGFERVVTLWTWADAGDALQMRDEAGESATTAAAPASWRDFRIDVTLRADTLTCMMLAMVTFVSTLVAIFAVGYMQGDRGYWRFFTYIALFVFSMTMLVSVSNFVLLFVFWEAVGVCSYLLIGFWYEKPEAAAAGKKAFLVNRVGDFGFTLAIFLIWTTYGTLNFHDALTDGQTDPERVAQAVQAELAGDASEGDSPRVIRGVLGRWRIAANDYVHGGVALAICLLLLLGACGKSAQFPLHVWLPDAMEGPTPVSALIHAATMVTAGVYMVARCTPLFMASPEAQLIVACTGAFTALLAGLIALTQFDLKRVLAYSTVSQLGLMFLGLGAGTVLGVSAGMFHLFTHAFFKALLFLGAGSVMHAMGNVIDMRRFGGLRHLMPTTHATFLVGCLALAGIPPLSGFWSKDAILASVEERVHAIEHELQVRHEPHAHAALAEHFPDPADHDEPIVDPRLAFVGWSDEQLERFAHIYVWLFRAAMLTAFLTAFYTFRAFYMTFYGALRVPREAGDHAHESPNVMTLPLVVLAVCAAAAGFAFDQTYARGGTHLFGEFLLRAPSLADGAAAATREPFAFHLRVAGTSTVIALVGMLLATYLYLGSRREVEWLRSLFDFESVARWLEAGSLARGKNIGWVAAIHRGAQQVGLGRLTSAIGQLIQLFGLVLSTPFLIGSFVSPYKLSRDKFYVDELYQALIVLPLRALAGICYAIDRWVIDGAVNLIGRLPVLFGGLMRSLQMGLVQFYALAMVLGLLVLFAARLMWAAG